MNEKEYFLGDVISAEVWRGKYSLPSEKTPEDMHVRIAKSLASHAVGLKYKAGPVTELSHKFDGSRSYNHYFDLFMELLGQFKYIIPQGSIMNVLGSGQIGSLSNCFVVSSPLDSYSGIFRTDQEIAQIQKRRGGVGLNINSLRPEGTLVKNVAKSSTGAHSFMDRFSNTTREVAQGGRK